MTLKKAKAIVNAMNFTLRRTGYGNEVRLCFKGGTEASAYYTDDIDDAVDTAYAIHQASTLAVWSIERSCRG